MTKFGYLVLGIILLALGLIGALAWHLSSPVSQAPAAPVATSTLVSCAFGSCPFEIHEEDSGKTFTYSLTSRFTVILDATKHPKEALSCAPAGMLGPISNIPAVSAPLYAVRYEAVATGTCMLSDGDFTATIRIVNPDAASKNVKLYYYDPSKDEDATGNVLCSARGLVPVERSLPADATAADAVKLLLAGDLSSDERAAGITTEFPLAGVALASSSLDAGTLTLTFSDPQHKTSGGSCRASILWKEIETTAAQFPNVSKVVFAPADLFQP